MKTAEGFLITAQQRQLLGDYLGTKPWNEANPIIQMLLRLPPVTVRTEEKVLESNGAPKEAPQENPS